MNAYNAQKYLKEAIDSIYAQTFIDWEIIFIDNCSTDKTKEIAMSYNDIRMKYYKTQKNIPIGEARNFGLKYCTSQYLAFLDTDDVWTKDKLKLQIELLDKEQKYAYCYTDYELIDSQSKHIKDYITKHKNGYIFNDLLSWYEVGMPTIIIRKSILDNLEEKIDTTLSYCPDYDLFMRIASEYPVCSIKKILAKYRRVPDSLTSKTKLLHYREIYKVSQKLLKLVPDIESLYPKDYAHWQSWISKLEADYYIRTDNLKETIRCLKHAEILGERHKLRYQMSLKENALELLKKELMNVSF